MAKEKQVVKMAKVIETTEQIARDAHCGYPSPRMTSSDLYDKGYRERSEVAREIFEEIEVIICKYDEYPKYQLMLDLAELKKKYTEGET